MALLVLVVASVAVVRLTRLFVSDEIMVGYRRWVVNRFGSDSRTSYLVHCPWCTSMWVAAILMPVAVAWPNRWVLASLAIPAASLVAGLILEREK